MLNTKLTVFACFRRNNADTKLTVFACFRRNNADTMDIILSVMHAFVSQIYLIINWFNRLDGFELNLDDNTRKKNKHISCSLSIEDKHS